MTIKKKKAAPSKRDRNLHDRLALAIGERILGGEFQPGTLLPNEAEWGRIYSASRTAIREAIKSLTAKGLIVSKPKVGSRVEPRVRWNLLDRDVLDWHHAAIDRHSFLQSTQEARRLIEPGIAALAARKHSPGQLDRLAEAVRNMGKAKTIEDFNEADVDFHEALLAAANNDLLMPFGIVIEKALYSLFDFTIRRNPRPQEVLRLHERIARAVAAGDESVAFDAMTQLLDNTDGILGTSEQAKRKVKR